MSGTTAQASADFGCKGRRRVRLTRGFDELRPVVRVSRLVGFLALVIALVSLRQVGWMSPGTERSPAGPSAPQLPGKWTHDAADVALTRDFAAQAAEVVEGAGFFRSPHGFAARPETTAIQEAVEAAEEPAPAEETRESAAAPAETATDTAAAESDTIEDSGHSAEGEEKESPEV